MPEIEPSDKNNPLLTISPKRGVVLLLLGGHIMPFPDLDHVGEFVDQLKDELDSLIESWTIDKTPQEVMLHLQKYGVAAGAVQNNEDKVVRDPQLQSRGFIQKVLHREAKQEFETDSLPIKFSSAKSSIRQGAPPLGGDNVYVFKEILGLSDKDIITLEEDAII